VALLDANGNEIQTYSSDLPDVTPTPVGPYRYYRRGGSVRLKTKPAWEDEPGVKWGALTLKDEPEIVVPVEAGLNRFIVPIQHPGAWKIPGVTGGGFTAPLLVPGAYQVRLTVGDHSWVEAVQVLKDPRVSTTEADFEAQYEFMVRIREQYSAIHTVAQHCRDLRQQLDERLRPLANHPEAADLYRQGVALQAALTAVEGGLIQVHTPMMLDGKLNALGYKVARSDDAPTEQAYAMYDEIVEQAEKQFARFQQIVDDGIAAFNRDYADAGWPALILPEDLP